MLEGRWKNARRALQGHYCQTLTKYDYILIKYGKHHQIHVEQFQERHFRNEQIQRQEIHNVWGGGIGV